MDSFAGMPRGDSLGRHDWNADERIDPHLRLKWRLETELSAFRERYFKAWRDDDEEYQKRHDLDALCALIVDHPCGLPAFAGTLSIIKKYINHGGIYNELASFIQQALASLGKEYQAVSREQWGCPARSAGGHYL